MCVRRILSYALCIVIVTLLPLGCAAPDRQTPEAQSEPSPATQPLAAAVSSLEDVKSAVVQIEAQGSFVDPQLGHQLNAAGRGTGFLIDPSGLAITNNHVATGAAFLKVWVGGETEARNARVLGVSECSDLAVIQIEGSNLAYLEWYEGAATPGLEVYVAGFPLGDPEYTLTRGIVSKERADGDTAWASVTHVIEHDAAMSPGNSGGPLVTADGLVVGVNFASDPSTRQGYAIGRAEVQSILDQLIQGQDVTSIGVNGQIVADGDLTGLWVASVESGSPADRAGIRGGDLILELEGLALGMDGTMRDYCSVLRSRVPADVLTVRVLRYATGEVLEGQINGRELAVVEQKDDEPAAASAPETGFVTIRDDTGSLEMQVPDAWSDVRSNTLADPEGRSIGLQLIAAPDADAFMDTFDAPGVTLFASRTLAQEQNPSTFLDTGLDQLGAENVCATYEGREPYSDALYSGYADVFSGCGVNGNTSLYSIAALPADGSYLVVVTIQLPDGEGLEILQAILDSFWVPGDLP